jgi:hypothetical protein
MDARPATQQQQYALPPANLTRAQLVGAAVLILAAFLVGFRAGGIQESSGSARDALAAGAGGGGASRASAAAAAAAASGGGGVRPPPNVPSSMGKVDATPRTFRRVTETHDKWIVVTTINPPTDAVKSWAAMEGWRVVAVGDTKTPPDWAWAGVTYLSPELQVALGYRITERIPWRHYSRKNVGYLFAVAHGARFIYDTDDDNEAISPAHFRDAFAPTEEGFGKDKKGVGKAVTFAAEDFLRVASGSASYVSNPKAKRKPLAAINPYPYFGDVTLWPRGFPLETIGAPLLRTGPAPASWRPAIQQSLANGDPDMDAIFRLVRKQHGKSIEIAFEENKPLVYPLGVYSPYNSQNTLFWYDALWATLIPITTTFRVCDIWRGYWTQRILWDMGGHLAFVKPAVAQVRNPHDYLDDFLDEGDLYGKASSLIHLLDSWSSSSPDMGVRMVELAQAMATAGMWGWGDVHLIEAWVLDLRDAGYVFPDPLPEEDYYSHTGMGGFRAAAAPESVIPAPDQSDCWDPTGSSPSCP